MVLAYDALLLAIPVALFLCLPFVEVLFAAYQGNFAFDQVTLPVQRERDAGEALGLYAIDQLVEFACVQQQFAGAGRVGDDVRTGGLQRRDVGAQQKGFVVLEQDVAVDQLHLTLAQALYFPAGQCDAGFEALLDEIVVFGLFVQRNGAAVGRGFLLLAHRRVSIPVVSYAVSADFAGGGLSCLRRFDLVVIG